jgi:hypothetical protein
MDKRIKISFSCHDNESAERGAHSEEGWEDEKGVPVESVEEAIKFLVDQEQVFPNGTFHQGIYYYGEYVPQYDGKGTSKQRAYFPEGFTVSEQLAIYRHFCPVKKQDFEPIRSFVSSKTRVRHLGGLLGSPITVAEFEPGNGTKYTVLFVPTGRISTPALGQIDTDGDIVIYDRTRLSYLFPHSTSYLSREYVREKLFDHDNPVDVACVTAVIACGFDRWTDITDLTELGVNPDA